MSGTPAVATSSSPRTLTCYSFDEFSALANQERRGWRWEGVLPAAGTVLLVGQPHAGKTTLIAALTAAMSSTGELADRHVKRGKTLFVSLEHSKRDLRNALAAAARGAGTSASSLRIGIVRDALDLDSPEDVEALDRVAADAKARVIVIDPFRRSTRIDENRAEEVSRYCQVLQKLTANGKRLVIVIHHLTKNGDLPRGSMDFVASVDSWIRVTRTKKDLMKLDVTHHGAAPLCLHLTVVRDDKTLTLEEAVDAASAVPDKVKEIVLTVIRENPGMGARKLRESVRAKSPVGHDVIDRATRELSAEGRIENTGGKGGHRWVIAEAKP